MVKMPTLAGRISPGLYALVAPALLASQNGLVMLVYRASGVTTPFDAEFWLLPIRHLTQVFDLTPWAAATTFAFGLLVSATLALLSFRRANWSGGGYVLAALTIVPGVQIAAVALLAVLPRLGAKAPAEPQLETRTADVVLGVLAGVTIIVLAVLISAVTFGAYGWGLFVMTPLLVGVTTGYLANRRGLLSGRQTARAVLLAAVLGTLALVMFALEGLMCIVLAAPLGAVAALIGGAIGRAAALARSPRDRPLLSVALLPALFALEAAMPPMVPIASHATIDIAAPPAAVWMALTSAAPIMSGPGIVGLTGLAYPIRGRLLGTGVGAMRLGEFSTGIAREQVTEWMPGRRLTFVVLHQPPAMEEMSPYRKVHAPHLTGYFETGETRFSLTPLPGNRTRLTVEAAHALRIDPALYWEPVARFAVYLNVTRVLQDIRTKAERQ